MTRRPETTAEQDANIARDYPAGIECHRIIASLNAVPGKIFTKPGQITTIAQRLGLSRPRNWLSTSAKKSSGTLGMKFPRSAPNISATRSPISIEPWRLIALGGNLGVPLHKRTAEEVSAAMRREEPDHPGFVVIEHGAAAAARARAFKSRFA